MGEAATLANGSTRAFAASKALLQYRKNMLS